MHDPDFDIPDSEIEVPDGLAAELLEDRIRALHDSGNPEDAREARQLRDVVTFLEGTRSSKVLFEEQLRLLGPGSDEARTMRDAIAVLGDLISDIEDPFLESYKQGYRDAYRQAREKACQEGCALADAAHREEERLLNALRYHLPA